MKKSEAELWAVIDAAFTDVVSTCRDARAAEYIFARKNRDEDIAQGRRTSGEDENVPVTTDRVHPRLMKIDDLVEDLAFHKKYPYGADLVAVKEKLRARLNLLKNSLVSTYSEEETHTILFPIVVYFDELVRFVSRDVAIKWETLQGEIYNLESGGEEFYKHLERTKSPPLAVEVYYYCLADGFQGMYADDPARIDDYKKKLEERFQLVPIAVEPPNAEPAPPELVTFPYLYYVVAAGAIVGLFVVLHLIGSAF